MNPTFDKELYKKVILLMALDAGYEADFHSRYVEQSVFDNLLKKADVGEPDLDYIKTQLEGLMDDLIAHLQEEDSSI